MTTLHKNTEKKAFLVEDITISKSKLSTFRKNGNNLTDRELAISIIHSDNPAVELKKIRIKFCIPEMPLRFWENVIRYKVTGYLPEDLMILNMKYLTDKKSGIIFIDEKQFDVFQKINRIVHLLNYGKPETIEAEINLHFPL